VVAGGSTPSDVAASHPEEHVSSTDRDAAAGTEPGTGS
jgi:hypothetical protein